MKKLPCRWKHSGAFFILHVYGLRSAVFCDKVYRYIFGKGNGRGKTKKKWFKLWKTEEENQFCSGKRGFSRGQ